MPGRLRLYLGTSVVSAYFDTLARRAGVTVDELRELEAHVRRQYCGDEMMVELRLFRTLDAIASGQATISNALEEFRDAPVLHELELHLTSAGLSESDRDLVRNVLADRVTPRERLLLARYDYENRSMAEIAVELGLPESKVMRMRSALVERIRELLAPNVFARAWRRAS